MSDLQLSTAAGSSLAIGRYPRFLYDARGGGGPGECAETPSLAAPEPGWRTLRFDPERLTIPSLSWRTTRLLGLPLPPGIRIAIVPERLEGRWQPASGALELDFRARFRFSLAGLYRAPDLLVATRLCSAEAIGRRHRAQGIPLDAEGRGLLVGVAPVAPCEIGRAHV